MKQGRGEEDFDAFETTPIPLGDIRACLRDQGTEVRFGDILFIRSGETIPTNRLICPLKSTNK